MKRGLLVVVGIAVGANGVAVALAPGRIEATYGVDTADPGLQVLLRHRAVLLALAGAALVASAGYRRLRPAAVAGGVVSMGTYALFALTTDAGAEQRRVAVLDLGLLALLALATALPDHRGSRS